jgi:hypothetical protein
VYGIFPDNPVAVSTADEPLQMSEVEAVAVMDGTGLIETAKTVAALEPQELPARTVMFPF